MSMSPGIEARNSIVARNSSTERGSSAIARPHITESAACAAYAAYENGPGRKADIDVGVTSEFVTLMHILRQQQE